MHTNSEQVRVNLIVCCKDNHGLEHGGTARGLAKKFSLIESIQGLVPTMSPIHSLRWLIPRVTAVRGMKLIPQLHIVPMQLQLHSPIGLHSVLRDNFTIRS
jgi:hypothetical protein